MLEGILVWSLHHRLAVILSWLGVAVLGVWAFLRLPMDAFPDTTPVQVTVNTVAPALSPLEAEQQITVPIERALAGTPHLVELRSLSRFGLSQVVATFEDDTPIYLARQMVAERLQTARLPEGIARPELGPIATGLGEVYHYLMTSESRSLADVRTLHDWVVRPQLQAVPGVAEVNAWGGLERRVEVVIDPQRLAQRDLTLQDLAESLRYDNRSVGGGVIGTGGQSLLVRGSGLATTLDQIADVVVTTRAGVPLRIRDVAEVRDGHEVRRGAVTADGKGEVVLGLGFLLKGENSQIVTDRLALRLEEVRKSLPADVRLEPVYQRTDLIDHVLRSVQTNLLEGAALVVALLFLFLGHVRAGLIVALAIPLSMLFAFDLMLRAGIAGSLMSLGAIDFGLVVDSSVIQIENCVSKLSDPADKRSRLDVVRDAVLEVRRPTMFGELIILIVYLPILTLEGIEGKLFRPMAWTVVFALLGSMLLSLTLMPVLASLVLPRRPGHGEPWLVRGLHRLYDPVITTCLRHWRVVLGLAVVALGLGVWVGTRLGAEFVPRLQEGTLVVNTVRLAGVSLDESVRYGTRIEQLLLEKFPSEVQRVWTRTGTAEVATDPMGVEVSDVFVQLKPRQGWTRARTYDELVIAFDRELSRLPGMRYAFSQPIELRINEMVSGARGDLAVKLFGDDYAVLVDKAAVIAQRLQAIPGASEVSVEQVTGQPTLEIDVDREAAGRYGVRVGDVLTVVEALEGVEAGELRQGDRRFPIAVRVAEGYRVDEQAVGNLLVTGPQGERIPLSRLAKIRVVEGQSTVQREAGKRRIVVQANVRGRDVASFVAEAQAALQDLGLPEGYFLSYGGQFEHLQGAQRRLAVVVPMALLLILVLLYFTYGRLRDALRVFTGVPFAAVGGVLALWWRDLPFSVSAGVGFVALSGVAVLGDMVLVSTVQRLQAQGLTIRQAVEQAARRRLRPVLMTSAVAGLGFLPMALNTGIGSEVQRPLATVVIGGILTSTLLTLLVLPALYVGLAPKERV